MHIYTYTSTDSSDPTRREFFSIRLLKTYYPLGLNIEEEL